MRRKVKLNDEEEVVNIIRDDKEETIAEVRKPNGNTVTRSKSESCFLSMGEARNDDCPEWGSIVEDEHVDRNLGKDGEGKRFDCQWCGVESYQHYDTDAERVANGLQIPVEERDTDIPWTKDDQ